MKTIEEIKNEISRDLGHESFKELFENAVKNLPIEKAFLKINCIINEASLNYAKEVAIASLEKASENAKINCNHEEIKKEFTDVDSGYLYFVDKSSITNEENIVLWKYSN